MFEEPPETIKKRQLQSASWCNSNSQLAACLMKAGASCEKLLHVLKGEAKFFD